MKKTILGLLPFLVVGSLFADDDLKYLVKSYSLEKIRRIFRERSPSKESEVYALVRFHEHHPDGDHGNKFRYLVSLLKGRLVVGVTKDELLGLIKNPLPPMNAVTKMSFWKLYEEMVKRKSLSSSELISYLKKLPPEYDPVYKNVIGEILRIHYENGEFKEAKEYAESFSEKDKKEYFGAMAYYRYAKALYKFGEVQKGENLLYALAEDANVPSYVKKDIYTDLKTWKGESFYKQIPLEKGVLFLPFLDASDKKSFISSQQYFGSITFERPESWKSAARGLVQYYPERLSSLFSRHKSFAEYFPEFTAAMSVELSNQNLAKSGLDLLEKSNLSSSESVEYAYARAYKRLGERDKYFNGLLSSLEKNPYNLIRQDELIDLLIGDHSHFLDESYWKDALKRIPNLPVKGRLVYWYLRSLKSKGKQDELLSWLRSYYKFIPGSYYTRVIREEFATEISSIQKPDSPLRNKDTLFEYLSLTSGDPKYSDKIIGRDLEFAYFPDSFSLDIRIDSAHSKVRGNTLLQNAKEYLEIGEMAHAGSLVDKFVLQTGTSEEEKDEILAALGEVTGNQYLTVFHTRNLMKRRRIPDDVILLPSKLASRIYPRPHRDIVSHYSQSFGIEEDIVYAVMRQESFFKENAVSSSNARGLMQIMGPTGKGLAQGLGLGPYSLFDPEISIQMGAKFLKYLLSSNENDLKWASIAYNGGPGNLRKWKRNHYHGDFNHFLEELPLKEPRDYCRIVTSNYYNYQSLRQYKNR
ncbi:lytic transglycosylase domain-containing protein [Leptospira licerasiae]|uniref:Transglycosylase SLT domain protein n=1 Tax=Leptospira licerasiae str. MMD4847 TaxID=1049971 RepID=A0ABN0H8H2_9LEPT|nr:lytic transglycosylase domain-containing protein [Leptospira licerasiae]EID99999.1 transglycosylase SLT domain protein [Leptospira licerasiae serovar Varillal str. VAR 010]EJZ42014.1 transglycosylase SLT domain protein [Leptospira licerasiae str. MMD4847]